MKCPYCGEEMTNGRIACGDHPIDWLPEGEMGSLLMFVKPENGIRLNALFSHGACAYCCKTCHKIILDYEED